MPGLNFFKFLNPWRFKRERTQRRLNILRQRDGDDCTRCRRPIRFDRPAGHDVAARIEEIVPRAKARRGADRFANLCLTHYRCNVQGRDHTEEVMERLRPVREAALFAKARAKRAA